MVLNKQRRRRGQWVLAIEFCETVLGSLSHENRTSDGFETKIRMVQVPQQNQLIRSGQILNAE